MKKIISLIVLALWGCLSLHAQDIVYINLNADLNGDTIEYGMAQAVLYDDGGANGDYTRGYDYKVICKSTCDTSDTSNSYLSVTLTHFNIGCYDTLYIYDGPSTSSPLLFKGNKCYETSDDRMFYVSATNTSHMLTIRFRASVQHQDDTGHHSGFSLLFQCATPCERVIAHIDSVYQRVDRNGNILGDYVTKLIPTSFDTIYYGKYEWSDSAQANVWVTDYDSIIRIDTTGWSDAIFLCQGQCVKFRAYGEYSQNYGYYTGADSTTLFKWAFGTSDTLSAINATSPRYCGYVTVGCYDVQLKLTDVQGCNSKNFETVHVRVAQNPIKTIFDLSPICNNDSLEVNVGYDGDNGTLTLRKITFSESISKTNEVRTFIPDGPNCTVPCYDAPVEFNEFPNGRSVQSAADICSICVNYEHSFMGDYSLAITCPDYDPNHPDHGIAYLKFKTLPNGYSGPSGTDGGGGTFTGCPAGDPPDTWDGSNKCDSCDNPFGVGLDYCFSRNAAYTLVSGEPCDVSMPTNAGMASPGHTSTRTFDLPIPDCGQYAGRNPGPQTVQTLDPSDHVNRLDYYTPGDDFSSLTGCPLNGVWNIQICDYWGIDNGWVFNWSLDICNLNSSGGCDYQVAIDSVVWRPDTTETDWQNGVYKGITINKKVNNEYSSFIASKDTAGDFRIKISIYDEFGCRWDTLTNISTVYTPLPNLGNDTALCDVDVISLDATDPHTSDTYAYMWNPFGESTGVIQTTPNTYADHQYVVEVINSEKGKHCIARDTINITVNPQPVPNFDPGIFPLEGCEPLTINIVNTTRNGHKYQWVFGDGTYSNLMNPSHTYAAGTYDFEYYVESDKGCKSSLIYKDLIHVYPSPEAQFSWNPTFPSVNNPTIELINNTTGDDGSMEYRWNIQYDKDIAYSFHTLTDKNPTFTWQYPAGEDASGKYIVRLIARSSNYAPSGQLIECADTVENNILIINDQISFPNVVTPNGDGINDVFIIGNLVEGLAFPNNQLDIFDKWGSRVFHKENISSSADFWDPLATNSPSGTYFYRFIGHGPTGNVEHNGVIEVIR